MTEPNSESVNALCAAFVKAEHWCSPSLAKMLVEYLNEGGYAIVKLDTSINDEESYNDSKFLSELGNFMHGKEWQFSDLQLKALELAKKYRGKS